jgi:hypothetical protein
MEKLSTLVRELISDTESVWHFAPQPFRNKTRDHIRALTPIQSQVLEVSHIAVVRLSQIDSLTVEQIQACRVR